MSEVRRTPRPGRQEISRPRPGLRLGRSVGLHRGVGDRDELRGVRLE